MKLQKVYSCGKVLNNNIYERLIKLDRSNPSFRLAEYEFLDNRDWWVILNKRNSIIAYCGCLYRNNICILNRAWVHKNYRGKGIQRRLINIRLKAAKQKCYIVITYTIKQNYASINNLIKSGFKIYGPVYEYGGSNMLYWRKNI